ncbi:energy-coupling factor ABC transporter ATP-binding protein [Geosporobacter ferrireducens]|uniref:ABC transporter domain-containing protein n=1 Tax=Geosporobacter ferrireducens TaxID=1424294 RepID=A0A1D8GF82_9FIRM|nr:ABC transporter ATP-binding protein [Geosporobacter ferrireducens]AOT69554.1 hypothetical protein Gferi_08170 [Geosporobacter ferrireducens]MTI54752.1 ABC transporter ATP-binding protein [Geosporobacter ferrireducens]
MDNLIEVSNITYQYHKGRKVFEDFSVQFDCRESTVITGKNGSGKTTLTKLIMGILKPQSGNIFIFGKNTKDLSLGQTGEMIGYVLQYPERQIFAASVMEELTFPLLFKGEKKEDILLKAEELIQIFELEKVRESYPFFLSYGEKRRLAIASVLMNNPRYLVLDEPTASLDKDRIRALSQVLNKLKGKNIGTLMITHDKNFIEAHGERIIQLEGGQIIKDEK